jgi:enamine deaminase RidA (YjgF/YER057c/UK114 family)
MAAKREGYQPPQLMERILDGQPIYWHVLSVSGAQRFIFISGQLPRAKDGSVIAKGDMAGQIKAVCENIQVCLKEAGATLEDLVRITCYTTDIEEFHRHAKVRNEYFGKALPASTAVEVRRLGHPDFMIEIEATAVV